MALTKHKDMTGSSVSTLVYPEFAKKWFYLSGASSGIGYAVAQALAASGAGLILMGRNASRLESARRSLIEQGAFSVETAALDIADPATPERARECVGDRPLRGILLNGGGPHGGRVSALCLADYEAANRLLLAGPAVLASTLLPTLEVGGSIVAISSTTVKEPNAALPLSAAYRSGLIAILKTLADELGPRGIRVNAVAPGYTDTARLNELGRHLAGDGEMESVREAWRSVSALKRIAAPAEIASVCAFLFSSQSTFITGQTLVVDGGQVRGY